MSLPSGYTQLEYIQSSGTQYVDTGVVATANTAIHFKFSELVLPRTGDHALLGSSWGLLSLLYSSTSAVKWYSSGNATASVSTTSINKVILTPTSMEANGASYTVSAPSSYPSTKIYLLNTGDNGAGTSWLGRCKIHGLQIYDNGTIIRDYIPCQTTAGEVGLWDDVNSAFYGNAGTGAFTAGPVIAIAIDKSEITELEYIQGSGTQYINTGIMPNQDTRLDLQASFAQTGSHTIVGADLGWTANGFSIGVGFAHYGTETSNINGMNDGLMHLISMDKNTLSVDGVSVHAFSAQTFFVGYPLVLFANNRSGSIEEITTMTLCSSQIYDNGTIVRNYIPCQTSSGEIGLWDALNKMFYRNAGTGTFMAGPVKVSPLNLPVNIGGTWKNANEVFVNIGGTWKTVEAAFVNIGGTWKELS